MSGTKSRRCLVVIGSGPGIGVHVAGLFASRRFSNVALIARSADRLAEDRIAVEDAAPGATVKTYEADVTALERMRNVMDHIGRELGTVECVFFNAARVRQSKLLEASEDEMIYDYRIMCTSLHLVAKWAMPQLIRLAEQDGDAKPSLLITSSLLPQHPEPSLFILSMVKAAQRNMAQSMAKEFGPKGVHVALVVVGGFVDPAAKNLNPKNIAEQTWALFDQPRDAQTFEVEIGDD